MAPPVTVRPAAVEDAPQMARVHVRSWQQTYRDLVPDALLDDPGLLGARERFWTVALSDERWSSNRTAVAELDGTIVGIAMSGVSQDADATWAVQLHVIYVIYVDAAQHGSGAAAALLDAVLPADESAVWWVAERNPRAQAFMRKNGFAPDGRSRTEEGLLAVAWVRPANAAPTCGTSTPDS